MKYVKPMRLRPHMTVAQLVREMDSCGVLGAGRLARATDIVTEMFRSEDYTVFLGLAGPMVPGGLRRVVGMLIDRGFVDAVVTTGANVVHDIIESLGYRHLRGSFAADDVMLRGRGLGRIGDIYVEERAFEGLEKKVYEVFDSLPEEKKTLGISTNELMLEIGKLLDDDSVLAKASRHGVPIFSPALLDSMIGLHLWTYSQLKRMRIDPVADLHKLSEIVYGSKKIGAILLGGGVPKHHILAANILREGVDSAVQITLDRPEGGGLSGAPLEEAVSWKKARVGGKFVTVIGDATIIFPILVAAVLERLEMPR